MSSSMCCVSTALTEMNIRGKGDTCASLVAVSSSQSRVRSAATSDASMPCGHVQSGTHEATLQLQSHRVLRQPYMGGYVRQQRQHDLVV